MLVMLALKMLISTVQMLACILRSTKMLKLVRVPSLRQGHAFECESAVVHYMSSKCATTTPLDALL